MCCIAELASLVFGIITLVTGKFTLTRNKVVYGAPARVVGALLVAILPVAFMIGLIYTILNHAQGAGIDPLHPPRFLVVSEIVVFFTFFSAAMIVALTNAGEKRRRKRRLYEPEEWDDEDDYYERERPRRRPEDQYPE